ncbi:hypothetical protein K2173_008195 [Erythroxylum novogranatense]|uniref:Uncharacterized protein n=1 Tax=Erythroxylum novogranatense TaxID=1862640 RepID=A0AAV8UDM2_9ROSI|nr:hypothetical protein K2173_008195 [Erythroxylum novogranatense]
MISVQSPVTVRCHKRKPLQPKNNNSNVLSKPNPNQNRGGDFINKENCYHHHEGGESTSKSNNGLIVELSPSLAEELKAIKEKLERMRLDKERTEKLLNERKRVLDLQMKELEQRGEVQRCLEIEMDRLYRLKQLHSCSMTVSPIRSLRERLTAETHTQAEASDSLEESVAENETSTMQSPCLSTNCSMNSVSSHRLEAPPSSSSTFTN